MKLHIEIELPEPGPEDTDPSDWLRYVLHRVPMKVREQLQREPGCLCDAPEAADVLKDINGNTVGQLRLSDA